jgi:heterodisulfide reductase subunit A
MSHIGIVICDCGKTLLTQEDVGRIASEITFNGKSCEHFFHLNTLCTEEGVNSFAKTIREKALERIVFAGCSPIQNQGLLERIASQAGVTPSAIYGVNIKAQLLLHAPNKEQSLARVIRSIQKAVKALSEIPSFDTKKAPLHQDVLVIGGGLAGISTAQELHRLGYLTTVVEQADQIGGQVKNAKDTPGAERRDFSPDTLSGVEILTGSSLIALTGQIGAFAARIHTPNGEKIVQCGVLVVASGTRMPAAKSNWSHIFLITDIDLAIADLVKRKGVRSIGLILDAEFDETKASTEMALTLAKNIQHIKRYQVYLFCRDVRVAARNLELLYDEVRDAGVNIVKYDGKLSLNETEKGVVITYTDSILCQEITVYCDRVGVSPFGLAVSADTHLAELLGLSTDAYGQLQDNNIHLFSEQTNRPGIFVVGSCRGQHYIPQIITEAKATALEVHALLSQKFLEVELSNAVVDPDKCVLCLTCVRSCPYKAMQVNREKGAAESIPEVCQKCGICAGECPAKAIELPVYSDRVILSQVE